MSQYRQKDNFTNFENDNDDDLVRKLDRFQNNKLVGGLQDIYDKYYKNE